jgi:hypothetical protein
VPLSDCFHLNLFRSEIYLKKLEIQFLLHTKHIISITETDPSMILKEIITVCSENRMKHIQTLCGQNIVLKQVVCTVTTVLYGVNL